MKTPIRMGKRGAASPDSPDSALRERLYCCGVQRLKVIRSRRKTISLDINYRNEVTIRVPYYTDRNQILQFVEEREGWIEANAYLIQEKQAEAERQGILTEEGLEKLKQQAARLIPQKVQYYAAQMGVSYGTVTLRMQKTKWGSCSGRGNLNFNILLLLAPPEILDYVIVHELCHRKYMDHSAAFWNEVKKYIPDCAARRRWLSDNGMILMMRGQMY